MDRFKIYKISFIYSPPSFHFFSFHKPLASIRSSPLAKTFAQSRVKIEPSPLG
jgi:hypothetical protein